MRCGENRAGGMKERELAGSTSPKRKEKRNMSHDKESNSVSSVHDTLQYPGCL